MSFVLIRECASSIINKIDRKINIAGSKNIILKGSAKKQKEGELVMRLNKKKLAAVMMSAVMAASVMPTAVFAEVEFGGAAEVVADDEVAAYAEGPVVSTPGDGAYKVAPGSVIFRYTKDNKDFTVDYQEMYVVDEEVTYVPKTATATVKETTDAKCGEAPTITLTVTIDNETFVSDQIVDGDPLEHKYVEIKRQTITTPTHLEKGLAHAWYKCELCNHEYDDDVILDEQDHTWGELTYVPVKNIKVDENGKVVLDENGKPELEEITEDGYYYTTYFCTKDNVEDESRRSETKVVYAKKGVYAKIISQKDIATNLVTGERYYEPSEQLPLDESKIELTNCDKPGSYVVQYYNANGNPISEEKIIVNPHHMTIPPVAEFKTKDDMNQCIVTYKEDGTLSVTNKSCYLPVTYDEVVHCTAAGCPEKKCEAKFEAPYNYAGVYTVVERATKTAEPTGEHVIKTSAKNAIAALVARGDVLYSELEAIAKVEENYVKLSADPSDCENGGKVTVTYLCVVDKKTEVLSEVVDVIAKGHQAEPPKRDKYVAPTCTETGSYDSVVECGVCGKRLNEERIVIIPRVKHTNELSVATNGLGVEDVYDELVAENVVFNFTGDKVVDDNDGHYYYGEYDEDNLVDYIGYDNTREFGVSVVVASTCDVCGYEVVLDKNVHLTIEDIEKQSANGEAGFITLTASYTNDDDVEFVSAPYTVPYFTSMEAYQARLEKEPEEALNGLHKDDDGVYRYYVDGVFQKDYVGIVKYAGGEFFVANGELCSEAEGLNEYGGKWYFLSQGQIQRGYTGLALYDGAWFYLSNGELNELVNGLVPYDGGTFLFAAGRLCNEVNGLWQDFDGTWYFLSLGQVQNQHNGVAMYDGEFFVIKNGKLDSNYNGTIEYDGAKFNVVAGQLYDRVA